MEAKGDVQRTRQGSRRELHRRNPIMGRKGMDGQETQCYQDGEKDEKQEN